MAIKRVKAILECDACGKEFSFDLDPAEPVKKDIADEIDQVIRAGRFDGSIQDGLQLCNDCTRIADNILDPYDPDDEELAENYQPKREEILRAVGSISR